MKTKLTLFFIMTCSIFGVSLFSNPLEIGAPAPQVSVTDHEGNIINLGAQLSTGTALVFFYPKAHTGGCTQQACSLRDGWDELQSRDVKVFGVSSDTAETQASFREKHQLPFTLIADTDQVVTQAFGKNRWSRQAYIFQDGVLVWRDLRGSTTKQADDVLAALDAMNEK